MKENEFFGNKFKVVKYRQEHQHKKIHQETAMINEELYAFKVVSNNKTT